MAGELANHVWQSTVFAFAAWLVTLALRSNRAEVRYRVWLSASIKFLLPFALLTNIGHRMEWASLATPRAVVQPAVSFVAQVSQPFPLASSPALIAQHGNDWATPAILGIWLSGFGAIALMRLAGWRRIRAIMCSSTTMNVAGAIEIRSAPGLLEPGVVGMFHPVLLLPRDITERLRGAEFQAVLAHELCHARRRDNLTAAIHMLVEAVFWFNPVVWWIGKRLIEERERACDEAVLSQGSTRQDYAQALLNVCKSYLESPLSCIAGVTGSDLKRRIAAILSGSTSCDLTLARKLALTFAGLAVLAVPVALGISSAPDSRVPSMIRGLKFQTASIKSCSAFHKAEIADSLPGVFHSECTTAERLIQQAYGLFANGQWNIASSLTVAGGPAWIRSDLLEIEASAPGQPGRSTMNGPMLQALLENRLSLKAHRESRTLPVYALSVVPTGARLLPFTETCTPRDLDRPPSDTDCATARGHGNGFDLKAATIDDFCAGFSLFVNRQIVNRTGLGGRFDFRVDLPAQDRALLHQPRALPAVSNPLVPVPPPLPLESAQAAMQKLGLRLAPAEGSGDVLAIDHIEKPSAN